MNHCVFCNSASSLNTQLTIVVDGVKVPILICDEHAPDATIRSATKAYLDRSSQIKEALEKVKSLGIDISSLVNASGIMIPPTAAQPQAQPTPLVPQPTPQPQKLLQSAPLVPQSAPQLAVDPDDGFISTSKIKTFQPPPVSGAQLSAYAGDAPQLSFSQYDQKQLSDKLPDAVLDGKVKMVMVEGRDGVQVGIPAVRIDGTGITTIKVVNTGGDKELQRRFRLMSDNTKNDDFGDLRAGYTRSETQCPICSGVGTIKKKVGQAVQHVRCPKCDGVGIITLN